MPSEKSRDRSGGLSGRKWHSKDLPRKITNECSESVKTEGIVSPGTLTIHRQGSGEDKGMVCREGENSFQGPSVSLEKFPFSKTQSSGD